MYNIARFRCAENCTPQDHFRRVMDGVLFIDRIRTPQKIRPGCKNHRITVVACLLFAGYATVYSGQQQA